jgi:hypothetical protein
VDWTGPHITNTSGLAYAHSRNAISQKRPVVIVFAISGFSLFSMGDLVIKFPADSGFEPAAITFFRQLFFLPTILLFYPWFGG